MKTPKVSVLMPVCNGEKYVKAAIESILNQTFRDFEFIILNDGSKDKSAEIISSFKDARIKFIDNGKNLGLVPTLNTGLDLATGEYIVRMDGDDISVKNRIAKQVAFMDKHKGIGACGSSYYMLRGTKKAVADYPKKDKEIKCFLLFNSPIAHPSVIIRASQLKKIKYSSDYIYCEDYDLWSRLSENSELANLSNKLLIYRMHENQITGSAENVALRLKSLTDIRARHLKKLGVDFSEEELVIHNLLSDGLKASSVLQLKAAELWLLKIIAVNNEKKVLDKSYLQKIIFERWLRLCVNFQGRKAIGYFLNSELYKQIKLPAERKVELLKSMYYTWKRKRIK